MDTASLRVTRQSKGQKARSTTRVKTFSGCATCRKRHLKCDERRPACQRCTKAKLKCSGYPGYRAQVLWKPTAIITDVGVTSAGLRSTSRPTQIPPASDKSVRDGSIPISPVNSSLPGAQARQDPQRFRGRGEPQHYIGSVVEPSTNQFTPESVLYHPGGVESSSGITGDAAGLLYDSSSDNLRTKGRITTIHNSPINKYVRTHLDELSDLPLQIEIIHHWITFLGESLMPIAESHNVCKDIFVPIASEGASSPANDSSGAVALFYLICAASAFHISANCEDVPRASKMMDIALDHHSRGVSHLQRNLAVDAPVQCEAILASLLLCITYEPVTVASSFWRTHFLGAASWLRKQDINVLKRSETAKTLYQCLGVTAIFLRARLTFEEIGLDANFPFTMDSISIDPDYLISVYGISISTLQGINRSISLVAQLRHHSCSASLSCSASSCTVHDETRLDRMELELYLALPDQPGDITPNSKSNMAYHYTRMFYFASLIYFKRILRSRPVDSVQSLVRQAIYHMTALEGCTPRSFAPFVWPVAVPFLEANEPLLQKQALSLLDFVTERSKLSIWPKLKTVLCNFWAKRGAIAADEVDDFKWDAYLNEPEVPDIMMA